MIDWLTSDTGFTHYQTLAVALSWAAMGYIAGRRGV